jgi:1-phosphatidylinositol phosphodiesterase
MRIFVFLATLLPLSTCGPTETRPMLRPNAVPINMASWQSSLHNSTSLSALSIPGTHDTMAYPKRGRILPLFTQTQKLDLLTQLRNGVRYLDIRLQHHKNVFTIHHGLTYLHFDLSEVLSIIETFLSSPESARETLIIRMACNNCHLDSGGAKRGQNENTREFWHTMDWYIFRNPATVGWFGLWMYWGREEVPTLGEARGKVVFIQDFPAPEWWVVFPMRWWEEEDVVLQDQWTVKWGGHLVSKLKAVRKFWDSTARRDHAAGVSWPLAINHLSASSWRWWPVDVAREVYRSLFEWMKTGWDDGGGRPMGVVVGDYVSAAVCRVVVEKNFLKGGAGEEVGGMVDFEWEFWNDGYMQEKERRRRSKGKVAGILVLGRTGPQSGTGRYRSR